MERRFKVILSTFGPLHLMKSAEYLAPKVDVEIIQGWLPRWWNRWLLLLASRLAGRDLGKTFVKRYPKGVAPENNHSVGLAEFYLMFFKLLKVGNPMKYQQEAAKLFGSLSKRYIRAADIFHVRSGSGAGGAIEKARSLGMKIVVDHSIAHPAYMDRTLKSEYERNNAQFETGMDNPFWREIVAECEKADVLLVNSQFVKDTFVEQGFDASHIRVVTQGVRPEFFGAKNDYTNAGSLRILFTGGFGFRKGAEYLLKALCRLDEEGIAYEMTIIGDYSGGLGLYEKYKPQHVRFIYTIPQVELKQYLARADVYLFPSLSEGCASSGMEAMGAGLAVVSTKESGLPIEHGVDGIIVPSKNVDAVVESLKLLNKNRQLIERYGKAAAKKIQDHYTWEDYAEQMIQLYQSLP